MYEQLSKCVLEFFNTFGWPDVSTQVRLVHEEYSELLTGKNHFDNVADLAYVLVGLYLLRPYDKTLKCNTVDEVVNCATMQLALPDPDSTLKMLDALALGCLQELFMKVHEANMKKLWDEKPEVREVNGKFVVRYRGKVVKPPSWIPPVLEIT